MKWKYGLFLCLAALLLACLPACAKEATPDPRLDASDCPPPASPPTVSVIPPEEETPPLPYTNPLTGEGLEADVSGSRPVAIMLNNLKKALPQAGVSQADIIYEILAEGGITRMLAVFQSVENVGEIGTVRSARDYYVSLAYGHDAIFLHAGGSPQAYDAIQKWQLTALDCVNGPYEGTLFWRDAVRRKNAGLEHSVLTSGEKIMELLPTYSRVNPKHWEGYQCPLTFLAANETASGDKADIITVQFSSYKTGVFTYDPKTRLYAIEEYDAPYIDANTGEQVQVKNVLVLHTDVSQIKGDSAGRLSVRTTGSGSGQFFCDGTMQDITWSRKDDSSPMVYTAANGKPLQLGVGKTYVNIIGGSSTVTVA